MAGCLPDVQGLKVDTLWDSGASGTIVANESASNLEQKGAVREPTERGVRICGIGDGEMYATERLKAIITFSDGIAREISALIVPSSPHELILGLDFMQEQKIIFSPTGDPDKNFKLMDGALSDHPVIYDSSTCNPDLVHSNSVQIEQTESERICAAAVSSHSLYTQVSQATFDEVEKGWQNLPEENRELIEILCSARLVDVPLAELEARLQKSKFFTADIFTQTETVNSTTESKLECPKCDFPEFQTELDQLINKHAKVFSSSAQDVGKSTGKRVVLKLKRDEPVNERNYRTAMKLRPVLQELVNDLMEAGVIEKCLQSEYNSPCLLVPKKADRGGEPGYRLVIDYRGLNKIIENVVYPMPRIQDLLTEFNGCQVFSYVDIRHAFFTIELHPNSRSLTAFSCEFGKWQFKFLPQGLKISPAVFQGKITDDLRGLNRTKPYMDDILTGDPLPAQQIISLDQLLTRLGDKGYKLKLSKCLFMKIRVPFLGADVTKDGIAISEDKKTHARAMTKPSTLAEVKSLLGFSSFLRAHVPYYCDIVHPIQSLVTIKHLTKNAIIVQYWTSDCELAFRTIVELMCSDEILAFPDTNKSYILYTDASGRAMSAVLFQRDNVEKLRPIGYWAKSFSGSQKNWAALVKEARAVYEAVKHYDVFLVASETVLRCDHKPLARFLEQRTKNEMVNRWSLEIQHYKLKFEWVASEENLSDCLSRMIELFPKAASQLFKEHSEINHEFPPRPKLQDISREVQVNIPPTGSDMATAAVAHVNPPNEQLRRPVTDEEEARLLGLAEGLTIKQITRLSTEQVKYMQERDNYCKRIIRDSHKRRSQNGSFEVRDGLLYRCYSGVNKTSESLPSLALVIPKSLTLTVIASVHKELHHAGRDKMVFALRSRCYWKNMYRNISDFVRNCTICQRQGLKANQYKRLSIKPPAGPGARLAIDLWKCEYGMCLTAIDLFSQYPFAEVIEDGKSLTVCNALQNIFSFVTPREILSDNGGEFISDDFAQLMKHRNIVHRRSAPHSPQTNGVLERFHRYLNACVMKSIHYTSEKKFWPAVRSAIESYRKLPHTQTGEAPMFLFMAQEPVYSIDHLLPTLSRGLNYNESGSIDLDHLHTAYALGRKNLVRARLKNDHKAEMHDREPRVGDRVLLRILNRKKTDPHWEAGWRIVSMETLRTAVIVHSGPKGKRRVNVRHLRLADPVAELLSHSCLDAYPGATKMYLSAEDLDDLDWEALTELEPLPDDLRDKANEIVRPRNNDLFTQEPPEKRRRIDPEPNNEITQQFPPRRSRRKRSRPVWYTAHVIKIE